MSDIRLIDANALLKDIEDWHDSLGGTMNPADWGVQNVLQSVMDSIIEAEDIDAVPVVRCRECKNGAPLPEEAIAEFSPGVMRCLAGRGDCDRYCTTWEDGFCDEGAKKDEPSP